ncbi:MAG: hypothetical protein R3213_02545, partial [Flavobacteriaceae bacterium]|nr:hypothetical protein [Flavobacteriaceae bacterium]
KSLDETPERCGYTNEQISKALSALSQRSVKQIGSDAAHLYHLLLEKDLVPNNEHTQKLAKSHPEIMKLRFDKERSNLEDLPEFIRKPIIKIYQKYSDGSVKLTDRKWIDYNPIEASEEIPYFLNKKHENAIQKG